MWFPWANHPKFIHKVIGCQVSTRKFTQDLQRFSKFQVPNHQFFCEVPKRSKGLAVQKPGKSPNRQISNLRLRYGFNIKSYHITENNFWKIIKCQDWGRFVRNPFSVWGYSTKLDSTWRAARHFSIAFKISTHHFFQLQRLVSSSQNADIQTLATMLRSHYIHPPSMTTLPRLWVSYQKS